MRSKVTKLFDYTTIPIPAAMLHGCVEDSEIEASIQTLSQNHAVEVDAESVQLGDSVACRGESDAPRWNRLLLFYPGRGLCEQTLENACLGACVGEQRSAETEEGAVTLTVQRIVRRIAAPIDDALIRSEQIEGVETLEAYRAYYRSIHEPERRAQAVSQAVQMLAAKTVEGSSCDIDEEEAAAWANDQAQRQFDAMLAAGIDPSIMLSTSDFLSHEEALAQLRREFREGFPRYLVNLALVQAAGLDAEKVFRETMDKLAQDAGMSAEAMLEAAGECRARDIALDKKASELLTGYVETLAKEE